MGTKLAYRYKIKTYIYLQIVLYVSASNVLKLFAMPPVNSSLSNATETKQKKNTFLN